MKRTLALTAAFGLAATILFLPGGAAAASHGAVAGSGTETPDARPAPTPVASPPAAAIPVAPAPPVAEQATAVPAAVALPAPVPAPVAAVLTPPAPHADEHMAELCAAREVFCHVDSSGRYTGS